MDALILNASLAQICNEEFSKHFKTILLNIKIQVCINNSTVIFYVFNSLFTPNQRFRTLMIANPYHRGLTWSRALTISPVPLRPVMCFAQNLEIAYPTRQVANLRQRGLYSL